MAYTTQPPNDFAQRLATIRRHLHGLTLAIDALEAEMLTRHEPRPEGEQAAQRAREVVYQQGAQEVKMIRE
jgi:hypothetical protein